MANTKLATFTVSMLSYRVQQTKILTFESDVFDQELAFRLLEAHFPLFQYSLDFALKKYVKKDDWFLELYPGQQGFIRAEFDKIQIVCYLV